MILRAMLISGLVLGFFSGCSEATKVPVAPKSVKAPQVYQLKVVRVDKKIMQNVDVFSLDAHALKKIIKLKNTKKLSSEDRVLEILKNLNINKSLNLKDINYKIRAISQTKNEILVVGYTYYEFNASYDGYVLHVDKDSLDVKRMTVFKNRQLFDISNDTKNILVNEIKKKKNYVEIYSFDTGKFIEISSTRNGIKNLKFSPKGTYVVLNAEFKIDGKQNARLAVYDSKTTERVLIKTAESVNEWEAKFKFAFSPDEKYLFTSESGYGTKDKQATLYTTSNFKSILNFFEEKTRDFESGWGYFMLTNDYLLFEEKNEIYSLKTKKLTEKVDFNFASMTMIDKKDKNLLYMIGSEKIGIYYIKDENIFLIKKVSKQDNYPEYAFVHNDKFYLFPSYKSKFQIIDMPNLEIDKYNFKLVKQLKEAKKFYNAGFKAKSLSMYKKMMSNSKDFSKYFNVPRYTKYMTIHSSVNLQKYKINGDIDSLGTYIRDALRYGYIKEASKALNELKKVEKKELYTVMYALYLAQIGKEQKAYNNLVEAMPFSQKIVDLMYKNRNSSLKLFKDKAKLALIFGINESEINYSEQTKKIDFMSFDGYLIDAKSKSTKKIKTEKIVTPKQNAIKLLD